MDNFWQFWQILTILTLYICWIFLQLRQFSTILTIEKTVPGDFWHLRHWLQFWQLRCWIQTISITWQLIVTLDSNCNSCDVLWSVLPILWRGVLGVVHIVYCAMLNQIVQYNYEPVYSNPPLNAKFMCWCTMYILLIVKMVAPLRKACCKKAQHSTKEVGQSDMCSPNNPLRQFSRLWKKKYFAITYTVHSVCSMYCTHITMSILHSACTLCLCSAQCLCSVRALKGGGSLPGWRH